MSDPQTFTEKLLRFTFTLGASNAKFQGNDNTLTVTGLRAVADIDYPGPPAFPTANVRIFGMKLSDMTALTGLTFGVLQFAPNNTIMIEANSGAGWTTVFVGSMVNSVIDFEAQPEVALVVFAQTLKFDMLNPATPTTFPLPATFEQVLRTIALKMGLQLDNVGVKGSFAGATYFGGTAADQLRTAAQKAGVAYYLDKLGIVEIGLPGAARVVPTWVLTPNTGLVSYPTLNSVNLIGVRAVFNPALRYGAPLTIKNSKQLNANGNWVIYDCKHMLSSALPDGPWFTVMTAQPPALFGDSEPL